MSHLARLEDAESVPESQSELINQVVVALAREKGWEYQLWYHDAPVWMLSREDPEAGVLRLVQVAIWREGTRKFLDAVPNVITLPGDPREESHRTMKPSKRKKAIRTLRVPDDLLDTFPQPIHRLSRLFGDSYSKLKETVQAVMAVADGVEDRDLIPGH